jgi:hypothetical protein
MWAIYPNPKGAIKLNSQLELLPLPEEPLTQRERVRRVRVWFGSVDVNRPEQRYQLGQCALFVYQRQTEQEQDVGETIEWNDRGFNSCDAWKLSGIANWFRQNGRISIAQAELLKDRLVKYAGQLSECEELPTP